MEIHSIMDIEDGPMNGIPTMIEEVNNDDQNMNMEGGSGYGAIDDHIEEKQIYYSKKELQKQLYMIALKNKFEFKTIKSTTKLLVLQCVDNECKWRCRATKLGSSNLFQVMKYYSAHICRLDMISRDNRHASSWLVGEIMRRTYQVGRQYQPKDIITDIQNKYGVQISYDKAWRAREFSLNSIMGSPEESCGALPCYCYMLMLTINSNIYLRLLVLVVLHFVHP